MADSVNQARAPAGGRADAPAGGRADAPAGGRADAPAAGPANLSAALDMDTASQITGRLFAMAPRLVELLDLGAREYGMSYARGRVVAALHSSGPVVMRALSQAVGVSPRTITGLIDALEADGWAQRRAHPTDRRATIVALTPAAQAAFSRLLQGYTGLAADLLSGVPEDDQQRALAVIDHVCTRLDEVVGRGFATFAADPPMLPREASPHGSAQASRKKAAEERVGD
jgi:DNA-binding MarR family transcriptional regulator